MPAKPPLNLDPPGLVVRTWGPAFGLVRFPSTSSGEQAEIHTYIRCRRPHTVLRHRQEGSRAAVSSITRTAAGQSIKQAWWKLERGIGYHAPGSAITHGLAP